MNINWFPGHMAKTKREMEESLSIVDAVAELVDARVPISSRNPLLDELIGEKSRIVVFNKSDLADPLQNSEWTDYYKSQGHSLLQVNCKTGRGCESFTNMVSVVLSEKIARLKEKGQSGRMLRLMVVGIPNVGKSSFINRICGRKAAKTEDRPGVTRSKQWVKISSNIELLDTPGMLWHKIEDQNAAIKLALTGAIRDDILDIESLCVELCNIIAVEYPKNAKERYGVEIPAGANGLDLMDLVCKKRGFMMHGGEFDYLRCAKTIIDEFRGGLLGRITLEGFSSK